MPDDRYIKGKDKDELLGDLLTTGDVGSKVHEQQKAAIFVRAVEDLERSAEQLKGSIDSAAASSDRLGRALFWLNVVLALATVVGAGAALYSALS